MAIYRHLTLNGYGPVALTKALRQKPLTTLEEAQKQVSEWLATHPNIIKAWGDAPQPPPPEDKNDVI